MPKRTYQPKTRKRAKKTGFNAQRQKKSGKKDSENTKGKSVAKARNAKGRKRISHSNHPRYK
jgi:ribosomal protein L34